MANLSTKTGVVPGLVANYQAGNFAAQPGFNYLVNTTAAAITLTMPTGSTGAQFQVSDALATWATNSVVLTPATGQKIQGLNANDTLSLNISGAFVLCSWDSVNTEWVITGSGFQYSALASATSPGIVSTTTQTFAGAKTFNGTIDAAGGFAADTAAYATASVPGLVSTTTQTFAGAKTFQQSIAPQGGIIGSTTGTPFGTGMVGELPGSTTRTGTNGNAYTIRGSTVLTSSPQIVVSATLQAGNYLIGGMVNSLSSASAPILISYLQINGTQVTLSFLQTLIVGQAGCLTTQLTPISISANGVVVALVAYVQNNTATTTTNQQEMVIIRTS